MDPLNDSDSEMAYTDPNNNSNDFETKTATSSTSSSSSAGVPKEDKYSLRPRSVRRVTETPVQASSVQQTTTVVKSSNVKQSKQKNKPAPLSKYRRKTANARERNRMREINQAFETLRRVIPQMASSTPTPTAPSPTANNEKLTKITTLRLAMKYISSLSAALTTHHHHQLVFGEQSPMDTFLMESDCLLLESDGESLPLSDDHSSSLLASPDFPEPSLSPVDFGLQPFFAEHADFSEFLLT